MTKKFVDDPAKLQDLIDHVQTQMVAEDANSDDFQVMAEQLERLYKMKTSDKSSRVSPDAVLAVAGNLLGIGLILNYERMHIVTTKALGFVMKTKA